MRNAPPTRGSVSARVACVPDGFSHVPKLSASSHASKSTSAGAAISRADGERVFVDHDDFSGSLSLDPDLALAYVRCLFRHWFLMPGNRVPRAA